MEIADEKYFILEDYSNKCRCCFKTIADSDESNKITKEIEEKFLELTQLEVSLKVFIESFRFIDQIYLPTADKIERLSGSDLPALLR